MLLQILDDGRITDGQGRTVDFKNTIIIMTSNIGSEYLLDGVNDDSRKKVMELVKASFKPEFLNRIDEIILFNPLSKDVQCKIVEKMLRDLSQRLEKNNIRVEFTDNLKQYVLDNSYNTTYGARPIKRFIQKNIETLLAKSIISSEIVPYKHYLVDFVDGNISIKNA